MSIKRATLAALVTIALPAFALAEEMKHDHKAMQGAAGAKAPSSKAYAAASAKMHSDMSMDLTGDADVDFVRGMIPHHQGAIDMAKVELQYGKDKKLREMAEEIIKSQEAEIAEMQAWLKKHGH